MQKEKWREKKNDKLCSNQDKSHWSRTVRKSLCDLFRWEKPTNRNVSIIVVIRLVWQLPAVFANTDTYTFCLIDFVCVRTQVSWITNSNYNIWLPVHNAIEPYKFPVCRNCTQIKLNSRVEIANIMCHTFGFCSHLFRHMFVCAMKNYLCLNCVLQWTKTQYIILHYRETEARMIWRKSFFKSCSYKFCQIKLRDKVFNFFLHPTILN